MRIITVEPRHIPALAALGRDSFIETFGYLYPPDDLAFYLEQAYAEPVLAAAIADPAQDWRMGFDDDGRAAAYLQCGPVNLPHPEADPAREGELKRLYIHSDFQGRGLGRRLLGVALDLITQRYGRAAQWIGVWSENHKAQALYRSVGFEKVGDYQFSVGKTLDDEFILRRSAQP
ncbi:GNAT family N-acetyltransferase [Asticcacaulis sp. EMRT-3]|uniref:GNAT family N-acetyltransferase n=1 Tax=Asticcacaulis sp. EMRT-3 TaxID=3040349 RepID=UPI0024AE8D99|nr:GNAT family N-acetyltransferase [Asticcacaulis sp. EMRT-3]MDI7773875.1 GNAT family N-acetyltransferase [Asticcacaulis sp. EMRT-3]